MKMRYSSKERIIFFKMINKKITISTFLFLMIFSISFTTATTIRDTTSIFTGNVTAPFFLGDGSQLTGISGSGIWTNVSGVAFYDGNVNISGNFTPSLNNTYSLGSNDLLWKDIHLGPGSIYLGNYILDVDGENFRIRNDTTDFMFFNTTANEMVFTTNTRTLGFSRGESPIKFEDGAQFFDDDGSKEFSIYHAHGNEYWRNVSGIFNHSTVFEVNEKENPYGMEFVIWDMPAQKAPLVINFGAEGRATTFGRSVKIGRTNHALDENYTRCDTLACNATDAADLEVEGSIWAGRNINASDDICITGGNCLSSISGEVSNVSGGGAFYGSLKWEATSNCAMGTSGGFATPTTFTDDPDCDDSARTAMGMTTSNLNVGNAEGQKPQIKFDSLPTGYYNVILYGNFRATATDISCSYLVTIDSGAINSSLSGMTAVTGSAGMTPIVSGLLYVPTDRGASTIELYGGESGANCRIQSTSTELEISVYYLPSFGEAKNDTVFSDLDGNTRINVDGNGADSDNITFTNNGTETFIIDSDGNVEIKIGNITTSNYGFFSWLGSLANRITKLWVGEINATGNIQTEANVTANYFIGDGSELTRVNIITQSTGLIQGGVVSINGGDSTLIDISEGSGQIVDSTTDPDNPTLTPISWENITGYNLTTMPDPGDVVAIYLALDSGGNVVERAILPTPEE